MIASFLRAMMDDSAVSIRGTMERKQYEYLYILCAGLLSAGYIELDGKIVKPARWTRRVR